MDIRDLERLVVKHYEGSIETDLHTESAAQRLGKPANEVTPEERKLAKTQNYILMYSPQGTNN